MSLTPWKSLWESKFPAMREEMDRIFEDFFEKAGFPTLREGGWIPPVDVHESKKDVIVTIDIPAIDPKEVSLTIVDNKLTVMGERKVEADCKDEDCYRSERTYGSFQRTIQLPVDVVSEKARATYKNGVLKVKVPKSQKAAPREIKVEIQGTEKK